MGRRTEYSYNSSGRLDRKRLSDGTTVSYRYSASGTPTDIDDNTPVRQTLDNKGRVTAIQWPAINKRITFARDQLGRVTQLTGLAGQQVRYRYDSEGRLAAIALPGGGGISYSYDAGHRVQRVRFPNGVRGEYRYGPTGAVHHLAWLDRQDRTLAAWSYTYDPRENVDALERRQAPKLELRHDDDNRLIEERAGARIVQYEYRAGGDRITRTEEGASVTYNYDDAGQLTSAGEEHFTHDRAGNIVERTGPSGTTTYEFDVLGRLVKATPATGSPISFAYAPTGHRISRRDANGLVYFLHSGLNLVEEVNERSASLAFYVHGPGIDYPVAMIRGGRTYLWR